MNLKNNKASKKGYSKNYLNVNNKLKHLLKKDKLN